ncbi:MAG: mechanosensitive ion channel family protein [Rhodobacteraceae bacterium]|nr:mechanosensitive ion channel family protein [Paracoccaceae bacterium]
MLFLHRLLIIVFLGILPVTGIAQTPPETQNAGAPATPDYQAWNARADTIEVEISAEGVTPERLEQIRAELAEFRARFQAAQSVNGPQIDGLRQQLDALGAPPEDPTTEAPEVAERRAQLNTELAALQAPRLAAQEAFSRANALVTRVDTTLRTLQADLLLAVEPYPWNPANWVVALTTIYDASATIVREVNNTRTSQLRLRQLRENLPLIFGLLVFGGFVLLRGRKWIEGFVLSLRSGRIGTRVLGNSPKGQSLLGLVLSFSQVIVPSLAVLALYNAALASSMMGQRGDALAFAIAQMGIIYFIARWIGLWLFPASADLRSPLLLTDGERRQGRVFVNLLGLFVGLYEAVLIFVNESVAERAAVSVVAFPVIILTALALFRLSQLFIQHAKANAASDQDTIFKDRAIGLVGRATMAVAVAAPVLAGLGYLNAAEAVLFPTITSVALFAVLLLIQRIVADIYDLVTKRPDDAPEPLLPALFGFMLALASLPLFALLWGVRATDLAEVFTTLMAGFQIGETRIAPSALLVLLVVFGMGYYATRLLQGALGSTVLPKTKIDKGGQKAIISGTGYIGMFAAALIAISTAGIDLSGLAIVAGALSVGIGFGLQNIVSNFISGVILLIERPIAEGDWIEVGPTMGTVKSISVRSTTIETFDRTDVIVPNTDLIAGSVTNWTRYNKTGRIIVPVGVAYGTDTRRVERILQEIGDAQPLALLDPAPTVLFTDFGADALMFELRMILSDVSFGLSVRTEIRHQIAERFKEEGIEIPFAQRDIWLRNPEALRPDYQAPINPEVPLASERRAVDLRRDEIDTDYQDGDGDSR